MNITVAGTGYVGLVAGLCFAEIGHTVTCVDIDKNRIDKLKEGISPIFEKDVEHLMQKNYANGNITYTCDYKEAYSNSDVIFIGVGTPPSLDGSANLDSVTCVAKQIGESLKTDCLIVIKSTVPVGTNDMIEEIIKSALTCNVRVEVASNPEFLSQGSAVHDMFYPSRVILGCDSEEAREVLRKIYEPFNCPILMVSKRSAEMIKYASNNILALKISYMNEIANLCELVGADIEEVAKGMSYDERIGKDYLEAGVGYGGSCFPKDTIALTALANDNGVIIKTIEAAIDVNNNQKLVLFNKAIENGVNFKGLNVAILGLTFKPGTDDVRESPAMVNVIKMLEKGAIIKAYDPVGINNFSKELERRKGLSRLCSITYYTDVISAIKDTDICFIFTKWHEIIELSPMVYRREMKKTVIYDGRNIYDKEYMKQNNIEYISIGR